MNRRGFLGALAALFAAPAIALPKDTRRWHGHDYPCPGPGCGYPFHFSERPDAIATRETADELRRQMLELHGQAMERAFLGERPRNYRNVELFVHPGNSAGFKRWVEWQRERELSE